MTENTSPGNGFRLASLVVTRKRRPGPLAWLAALFGLYCLLLGLILPRIAKPMIEAELSHELGVACTIRRLTVDPFTWKITARDFVIPYPETMPGKPDGNFIRLRRLEVHLAPSSIKSGMLIANELRLVRPEVRVNYMKDGSLSPQRLFTGGAPGAGTDAAGRDLFPLVVRNMTVQNGTVHLKDEVRETAYAIEAINMAVPFASTLAEDRETALKPTLSATVNGTPVTITGETRPFATSRRTEFTLKTRHLGLAEFRRYIAPYTNLKLESGALHTALTLRFALAAEDSLDFSLAGTAEITDLSLAGPHGKVFSTPRATVDVANVLLGPRRVIINDATLENPHITVRRLKNGSLDWESFFFLPKDAVRSDVRITAGEGTPIPTPKGAANKPPAPPKEGAPVQLVVDNAKITGGKFTWHDATLKTPFTYTLDSVNLTFTDISTEKEGRADFAVSFGGGKGKPAFSATGKATTAPLRIEAAVTAKELPLAAFSGYVTEGSGLILGKGAGNLAGNFSFHYGPKRTTLFTKGSASVTGVQLRSAKDAATPLLDLGRLEAAAVTADLAEQSIRIAKLSGSDIAINLVRGKNGAILLPEFGTPPQPAQKTPAAKGNTATHAATGAAAAKPWKVAVDEVAIAKSRFSLVDTSLKNTATLPLADVTVTGKNFATHDKKQWTVTARGKPGERGTLSLTAKGNLSPLNLTFSGTMDKADMRPLSPYLLEHSQLALSEATLAGDFSGAARRVPGSKRGGEFSLAGNFGLYGITLVHGKGELGGWGRMRVEKLAYRAPSSGGRHLSIGSVTVNAPRLSVAIDETGVNSIQKALQTPGAPPAKKAPATAKEPEKGSPLGDVFTSMQVNAITVAQGQATYRDMRVSPPYRLRIDKVAASLKNLSLERKKESLFTLGMEINGSPLTASGFLTGLLHTPSGKGKAAIRSLDLARFTQYGEKYLGYPVKRGEMTADITASLKGKKLDMQNAVVIRKLELGKKVPSPHAADLPLAAAVAVLRDRNGDISLDLPVSGTLGDPEFKIGGVVAKLIGTIVLKTVTSPVAILDTLVSGIGNIFGGGKPADAQIVFRTGHDRLDKTARADLKKLGKELKKHSAVRLELTGMADKGEAETLIDAWVTARLKEMKYNSLPAAQKAKTSPARVIVGPDHNAQEYTNLLFAFYKGLPFVKNSKDPAVTSPASTRAAMRIIREKAGVTESQLLALGDARAKAVRDALTEGNAGIAPRIVVMKSVVADQTKTNDRISSYVRIRVRK